MLQVIVECSFIQPGVFSCSLRRHPEGLFAPGEIDAAQDALCISSDRTGHGIAFTCVPVPQHGELKLVEFAPDAGRAHGRQITHNEKAKNLVGKSV